MGDDFLERDLKILLSIKNRKFDTKNPVLRHIFTIGWMIVMLITFAFVIPFVKESGIKVLLSSTGLACVASYAYTIQKSRSIPKKSREDLLA